MKNFLVKHKGQDLMTVVLGNNMSVRDGVLYIYEKDKTIAAFDRGTWEFAYPTQNVELEDE